MRTYVKIEGKDVEKTVQKLAKIAVDLPDVCVWDINMMNDAWKPGMGNIPQYTGGGTIYKDAPEMAEMGSYFGMEEEEFAKHCDRLLSKSGADLEGANIYYEWAKNPTREQLEKLEQRIADIIKPTKMKYTITNK